MKFLLFFLFILLVACSQHPLSEQIQGCWETSNAYGETRLLFEADKVELITPDIRIAGTYKIKTIEGEANPVITVQSVEIVNKIEALENQGLLETHYTQPGDQTALNVNMLSPDSLELDNSIYERCI